MSRRPSDPKDALRDDLLSGERGAEERVRAHLAREAGGAGPASTSGPDPARDAAEDELASSLQWVGELARGLRAAGPDPDLARRICASLPVGRPRRTPAWRRALDSRAFRVAAVAASAALLGGFAWLLVRRDSNSGASELARSAAAETSAPQETAPFARWFGIVEYRDASGFEPSRRARLDAERREIETDAHERAFSSLDPWFAAAASSSPELYRTAMDAGQTTLEVDTASKVATQVYDARGGGADWMPGAYALARAYFGNAPVEGPILEVQVVRGSARLQHNGFELELHDADMVLLARQGAPLRVDAPRSPLGEPPSEAWIAAEDDERGAPSTELGTVEGFVRDDEGRSLERFDLTLWRCLESRDRGERLVRESLYFFTAPDGRFELESLEPGRYRLGVASPEHVTIVSDAFEVPRGGAPEALELALEPGATLRGKVLSAKDGQPLANARVRLAHPGRPWWWTASDTYGELRTERDGSFVSQSRASGYETLWIEAEGFASRWVPPVPLGADGAGSTLEIRLDEESVLHGYVSDALGEALPRVELRIHGIACCYRGTARTDERGYYRLGGLARGTYQVAVLDARGATRTARVAELGTAHVRREDFGGENARVVSGALRDERGRALSQQGLFFYELARDGGLRLAPSAQTTTDESGAFRVELAPNTRYRVRTAPADGNWSADLIELALDAARTAPRAEWTLAGALVSGTLCAADPADGAPRGGRLVLRAQGDESREWRASLRDGSFTFRAVPPGRYLLRGWIRGWHVPEREVAVGESGATLALSAVPAARVELLARDASGHPVLALAAWQRGPEGERRLRTRATPLGVLVEDLPAEAVELVLRAEGCAERILALDLAAERSPRVELELEAAPR